MSVVWSPQPGPQSFFLACPIEDVLYGGARGGGKSDGLIGDFLRHAEEYGELARGLLIRRTMPQLKEIMDRSKQIYTKLGWRWFEKKSQWVTDKGGVLHLAYLDRDSDAENYQGWNLNWIGVDEMGNFPSPVPLDRLYACLRSAHGVKPVFRGTANPGGAGHGWIKQRYIDPSAPLTPIVDKRVDPFTGMDVSHTRVYIPSGVKDNKILMDNDPEYIGRLYQVGNDDLVKAWLEGDWNVSLGQFFKEWNHEVHVVPERAIPDSWVRICAMDWGFQTPFCVLWAAVSDGSLEWPAGALIIYREFYGGTLHNDQGLRMESPEVARRIVSMEHERIDRRVADYQIFRCDNGPPIAEGFREFGIFWESADKTREPGWQQIHNRLKGHDYGTDEWRPMLYVMSNCGHVIRSMPNMIHDDKKPDDMLKVPGDHCPDTVRYMCQARPWVRSSPEAKSARKLTLNYLLQTQRKRRDERIKTY